MWINEWHSMTCYSNPEAAIHYVSIKILSPYHRFHGKLPITDAPQMLEVISLSGCQETDQTQDYHFHVGNAKVSVFPLAIWKWDQRYTHPRSLSWKYLTSFRILSRCLLNMNFLISLSSKYTIYMYNMYNYICIYICDLQHAYMLQVALSHVFFHLHVNLMVISKVYQYV